MGNERKLRLIQVAKEFKVGLNTVTDFLQKKGIKSDGSPNTLVDAETYAVLEKEFGANRSAASARDSIRERISLKQTTVTLEEARKQEREEEKEVVIKSNVISVKDEIQQPKFLGKIDLSPKPKAAPAPQPKPAPEAEAVKPAPQPAAPAAKAEEAPKAPEAVKPAPAPAPAPQPPAPAKAAAPVQEAPKRETPAPAPQPKAAETPAPKPAPAPAAPAAQAAPAPAPAAEPKPEAPKDNIFRPETVRRCSARWTCRASSQAASISANASRRRKSTSAKPRRAMHRAAATVRARAVRTTTATVREDRARTAAEVRTSPVRAKGAATRARTPPNRSCARK